MTLGCLSEQERQASQDEKQSGSGWCTGAQKVLVITVISNAIFTVSQFVGACLANSLALYGDSIDMGIDTVTYAINLWVERERDGGADPIRALKLEIAASLVSAITLIAATLYLFNEAIQRIWAPIDDTTEEPLYVLVFSGINLVIDFVQMFYFIREFRRSRLHYQREASEFNVNLTSAAAHVLADTVRTLSELGSAFLAIVGGMNPVETDAWGSFIVNAVVLISGIVLLFSVFKKWRSLRKGDEVAAAYHELTAPDVNLSSMAIQPKRVQVTTG